MAKAKRLSPNALDFREKFLAKCRTDWVYWLRHGFDYERVAREKGNNLYHPQEWQIDFTDKLCKLYHEKALPVNASIQGAVMSGHGVGKSAQAAQLALLFFLTLPRCWVRLASVTREQSRSVIFDEILYWKERLNPKFFLNHLSFSESKDNITCDEVPESLIGNFVIDKRSTDSAQGIHKTNNVQIIDEVSGQDKAIIDTLEAIGTNNPKSIALWLGNPIALQEKPNKNKYAWIDFFERKQKSKWCITKRVSSLDVTFANKIGLKEQIKDHGKDSDYVRVKILGMPPKTRGEISEFFTKKALDEFKARTIDSGKIEGTIYVGVDLAENGDKDFTAVCAICNGNVIYLNRGHFRSDSGPLPFITQCLTEIAVRYQIIQSNNIIKVAIERATGHVQQVKQNLERLGYSTILYDPQDTNIPIELVDGQIAPDEIDTNPIYYNHRAYYYFQLMYNLRKLGIQLLWDKGNQNDRQMIKILLDELGIIDYQKNAQGKYKITNLRDLKVRNKGNSIDLATSLLVAFYATKNMEDFMIKDQYIYNTNNPISLPGVRIY